MIRVVYNRQKQPPVPFVLVSLVNPLDGSTISEIPAQLDTAADRTLVPLGHMQALGLEPIDDIVIGGFGGSEETMPVFAVTLGLFTMPGRTICAVAHFDEPWVLLGRDVLNAFHLVLYGPNLALEID